MRDSQAGGKKPIKEAEKLRARKPKLERVSHYVTKDKKPGALLKGVGVVVEQARRKTGIDILGGVAWGTHFCVFYHSKQDLIDLLVPYFKAGLENNEFCMWITSEPLNAKEAKESLKQAVKNLDSYIKKGQIEILDYGQWYTKSGKFEADRVLQGWVQKHDDAIARGFDGLRLTGNTFWLDKKGWSEFIDYEESVNNIIGKYKMLAICTYSLDKCGASEVIDVVNNHQFAIVKREGLWEILESAEHKKAEEALQASEQRYRVLFENAGEGIITLDLDGRITEANRLIEEYGFNRAELLGRKLFDFVPEYDKARSVSDFQSLAVGSRVQGQMDVITPKGIRAVEYRDTPIVRAGEVIGVQAILTDITECKLAEEALKESEEKWRSLVENAPSMIIIVGREGSIQFINRTVSGYSVEDTIGRGVYDYIKPDYHSVMREIIEQVFQTGKVGSCEIEGAGPNGRDSWYEVKLGPIRHNGEIAAVTLIATNITERKRAEEALQKRTEELTIMNEMAIELAVASSTADIYKFVCEKLKGITGALFTSITSYDSQRQELSIEYISTDSKFIITANKILGRKVKELRIPLEPRRIQEMLSEKAKRLEGLNELMFGTIPRAVVNTLKRTLKIGDVYGLGLHYGGKIIGTMTVLMPQQKPLLSIEMLQAFANLVATSLKRMKAEQAMRESQENYRMVSVLTSDYIMKTKIEPNGQMVLVSATDRLENMTGYAIDELRSPSSWSKIVHPDDFDKFQDFWKRIVSSRKSCELEFRGIDRKQQFEWLHAYGQPMLDEKNDRVINIVFATKDITERKLAEEAYRLLVDHSLQGLAIFQEGRVVFANQAMADIIGYTVEEMLNTLPEQVQAFVHPDDRELVWSRHRGRLNGEELPERYEFRGIRKDGSTCWVEIHASRIEYQGKPAIQAAYVDITERKQAEKALGQSESQLKRAQEVAHVGSWYLDLTTSRLVWSDETCRIFGVPIGLPLKEEDFLAIVHPDDKSHVMQSWATALRGGPYDIEHRIVVAGTVKWVGEKAELEFDAEGKPLSGIGTVQDITERKKADEALRESEEKFKSIFEHAHDGIIYLDSSGKILDINEKAAQMFGGPKQQAVNKHFTEVGVFPADEIPMLMSNFEGIITDKETTLVVPIKNKKGQELILECSVSIAKVDDGAGRIMVIARDITERKKAEDVIAKLAKFPDEDPYPVLRISGRGMVIYANKASLPLLKVWRCRVGQSLPDPWHELVMDALSSGQSQQTEVKCDGCIFSITFAPVADTNYVNVYGLDITERKRAEEGLRSSRDYLKKLTDSMWDAVFSVKMPERVIEWANDSFRLIGYEPQEFIGKTTEFLYPDDSEFFDFGNKLKGAMAAGKDVLHAEQILKRKNGETFPAEITTTFFREKSEIVRVTSIVRDVSERKKAEDKLIEYQMKLKAMASKILMTEERERQSLAMGLHDEVCQKLVLTKLALESSLQLVSDSNVLASLRITCGAIGETIEQADSLTFELSNPVLRQLGFVIALEKYLTEEIRQKHGIEYELQSDEQLGTMQDEIKNCLFRVTRELLTNVVKHAQSRKVKVSVRESQGQIYVRVQDDGVGFKESQAGSKVSQTARFGLFSIREQLEYLGGHLEIESGPGRGTKATVVVPLRGKATV